jgi:hypothetical protein
MQWDLLPPLSARTAGALIAGTLEPACDIAADAFDHAINSSDLHLATFDGLGHGLGSTLLTGLAVGAYRHTRQDGAPVAGMHAAIDAARGGHYDDLAGGAIPALCFRRRSSGVQRDRSNAINTLVPWGPESVFT